MNLKFDSTAFGKVVIGGQEYGDVLVIGDQITPRDRDRLEEQFGTRHRIAPSELNQLLTGAPEVILLGTGQQGLLEVDADFRNELDRVGAKLVILKTPAAIKEYNRLVESGQRVNALIHVTC